MSKEDNYNVCSSNNKYVQTIMGNVRKSHYYSKSLKVVINAYYEIYQKAYNSLEGFRKNIVNHSNEKARDIFRNMMISNLEKDDKNVYKFELVSDYPISYRIPFTFNPSADIDNKLKYMGDKNDNLYDLFMRISYSEDVLNMLEESLSSFIIINKNYIFELEDSLPYVICFDNNKVSISNADDGSNNMIALVDIDLEKETISFHDSIADNEFTTLFKNYLLLILDNAFVNEGEVRKKFGYIGYPKFEIVDYLLTKYDMMEKKVKPDEQEKEPDGRKVYFINVPNEGYKPIVDFVDVNYNEKDNCYKFRFDDYSILSVPVSSVLIVDGTYEQANKSDAYKEFKKLTLQKPKKEVE